MAASLNLFLVFSISLLTTIPFSSEAHSFEKKTHLHFYFHEINGGPNSTTTTVTPQNSSAFGFGNIGVVDDTLREGPEPTSKLIGRAQGIVPAVSQEEQAFLIALNFVFIEGKYKGSTLDVFGRAVLLSDTRDWTIIGGTGHFKLARGYVHGKKLASPEEVILLELDAYIYTPVCFLAGVVDTFTSYISKT